MELHWTLTVVENAAAKNVYSSRVFINCVLCSASKNEKFFLLYLDPFRKKKTKREIFPGIWNQFTAPKGCGKSAECDE